MSESEAEDRECMAGKEGCPGPDGFGGKCFHCTGVETGRVNYSRRRSIAGIVLPVSTAVRSLTVLHPGGDKDLVEEFDDSSPTLGAC